MNLLGPESTAKEVDGLFYILRESFKRRRIDKPLKATEATSADSLAQVIQSEHVLNAIRQELRRQTGHRIESNELLPLLRETVIRSECLKA